MRVMEPLRLRFLLKPSIMVSDTMDIKIWNYGFNRDWIHEVDNSAQSPYLRLQGPDEVSLITDDTFACAMLFLALILAGNPLPSLPKERLRENSWHYFDDLATSFRWRQERGTPTIPPHFAHMRSLSAAQGDRLWGLLLKMTEVDAQDVPAMTVVVAELHAIRNM